MFPIDLVKALRDQIITMVEQCESRTRVSYVPIFPFFHSNLISEQLGKLAMMKLMTMMMMKMSD
jgi:hypothetical protein